VVRVVTNGSHDAGEDCDPRPRGEGGWGTRARRGRRQTAHAGAGPFPLRPAPASNVCRLGRVWMGRTACARRGRLRGPVALTTERLPAAPFPRSADPRA